MARYKDLYKEEIVPTLMEKLEYDNVHEVPEIEKITVNMGVGEATEEYKLLENAAKELEIITGQKAQISRAKKDIANFNIRTGMPIGCYATLRDVRMYDFLDRLINIAIPRMKDFTGLSPDSFDGRGNYSLGIEEQIIFPEINYDKINKIRGMTITITTTAETDEEAYELLNMFNFPFKKE